jgi:hypothetical protein
VDGRRRRHASNILHSTHSTPYFLGSSLVGGASCGQLTPCLASVCLSIYPQSGAVRARPDGRDPLETMVRVRHPCRCLLACLPFRLSIVASPDWGPREGKAGLTQHLFRLYGHEKKDGHHSGCFVAVLGFW